MCLRYSINVKFTGTDMCTVIGTARRFVCVYGTLSMYDLQG